MKRILLFIYVLIASIPFNHVEVMARSNSTDRAFFTPDDKWRSYIEKDAEFLIRVCKRSGIKLDYSEESLSGFETYIVKIMSEMGCAEGELNINNRKKISFALMFGSYLLGVFLKNNPCDIGIYEKNGAKQLAIKMKDGSIILPDQYMRDRFYGRTADPVDTYYKDMKESLNK